MHSGFVQNVPDNDISIDTVFAPRPKYDTHIFKRVAARASLFLDFLIFRFNINML